MALGRKQSTVGEFLPRRGSTARATASLGKCNPFVSVCDRAAPGSKCLAGSASIKLSRQVGMGGGLLICAFFERKPLMIGKAAGTSSLSVAAPMGLRTKPAIVAVRLYSITSATELSVCAAHHFAKPFHTVSCDRRSQSVGNHS
jgi:hypothetical protein